MQSYIVMGVAGCGKSTIGRAIADRLDISYLEADDLHPTSNIEKMERGVPLEDEDRWPWLTLVGRSMAENQTPVVAACSALRRSYRDHLRDHAGCEIGFIHLAATREVIAERMEKRERHFMPVSLLDSQFKTLEKLQADESGIVIDVSMTLEQVIDEALQYINDNSTKFSQPS